MKTGESVQAADVSPAPVESQGRGEGQREGWEGRVENRRDTAVTAPPPPPASTAARTPTARGQEAMGSDQDELPALFDQEQAALFRSRWNNIQTGFVDEP